MFTLNSKRHEAMASTLYGMQISMWLAKSVNFLYAKYGGNRKERYLKARGELIRRLICKSWTPWETEAWTFLIMPAFVFLQLWIL